ncbi:MAG TPA: hypothetical protein VH349_11545, partial [Ktedonobacterales bacterium]
IVAGDLFGWGVIYALHARACIERGRVWQAEHYVGAVRDHALSLACLREGLPAVQARGYDDLPAETLARFANTHVGATEPEALRAALVAAARALIREGTETRLPHVNTVAERLLTCADAESMLRSPIICLHRLVARLVMRQTYPHRTWARRTQPSRDCNRDDAHLTQTPRRLQWRRWRFDWTNWTPSLSRC